MSNALVQTKTRKVTGSGSTRRIIRIPPKPNDIMYIVYIQYYVLTYVHMVCSPFLLPWAVHADVIMW